MFRRLLSWWLILLALAAIRFPVQARSVAMRLVPWPPQGWPAGGGGELRLVTVGLHGEAPGPPVLRVPIAPNGRVVYDLGQAKPSSQALVTPLYELLDKIVSTGLQCELPAVVSPAEAMAVVGQFQVHVPGQETPSGRSNG